MPGTLEAIEEVHVHLHLAEVLVRELAELEVDEDEAAEQPVVEDEVDVEVVALERHPLLPGDEAETFAEFGQELLDAIDDQLDGPRDVLKDPFVLEFLGLEEKPAWRERELEQAFTTRSARTNRST